MGSEPRDSSEETITRAKTRNAVPTLGDLAASEFGELANEGRRFERGVGVE
jgi:hypothetical protein